MGAHDAAPEATPASEPAAYPPPAPEDLRDATLLTLRDPARLDDDPGLATAVSVVPGPEVAVLATVRNQGQIVDTFDLRVDGLPDSWWTISPATVFLNPWGTAGDYEQEVQVRLHPPRTPESEAREWPLTVVARSRSRSMLDADVAQAPATLTVEPFQSTVMHVGPERRRGRRHADFDVAVDNHGNSPMEIVDRRARHRGALPGRRSSPERTVVPVGSSAAAVVRVAVPRPLIFGRPIDHHIEVAHRATGVESEPVPQRVTFRQKPWLPWWVPPVVALLAAFIVAMLMLRRDPEVPKLKGDTVAEAMVVLKKHHLKLGHTKYASAAKGVPLNTIIAQEPAAGDDIVKGESVNITVAAPPSRAPSRRSTGARSPRRPPRSPPRTSATARSRPARGTTGSSSARSRRRAASSTRDAGHARGRAAPPAATPTPTPTHRRPRRPPPRSAPRAGAAPAGGRRRRRRRSRRPRSRRPRRTPRRPAPRTSSSPARPADSSTVDDAATRRPRA